MVIDMPIVFIFLPKNIISMFDSITRVVVWMVLLMPIVLIFFPEYITCMVC
jgi:hypothetical protein